MIAIGAQTVYGEVVAVGWVGERYYWLLDGHGVVSTIPASVVEPAE